MNYTLAEQTMSRAQYTIPALGALALAATATGCSEPIIGDWEVTQLAGETLPYSETGPYCSYYYGIDMSVTEEFSGNISFLYTAECPGYGTYDYNFQDGLSVTVVEKRAAYGIVIDLTEGDTYSLDCTSSETDILSCTDEDADSWTFGRKVVE